MHHEPSATDGQTSVQLEVRNLSKRFGGVQAVSDVSFQVKKGQIKALVGPNGAGKTTLFNLITRTFPATSGEVIFEKQNISSYGPDRITSLGIARTFQHPRLFTSMSIEENIMLGAYRLTGPGFMKDVFSARARRRADQELRQQTKEWLEFVGISSKLKTVDQLSTGQEKMVELARALISGASLILMDEPAAGLNDLETERLASMIQTIRDRGTTIFIVEHNMDLVMNISDDIIVMDHGKKIAEDKPEAIRNHPQVIAAYLGSDFAEKGEPEDAAN